MAKTPTSESNFKRNATKKELQDLCREHDLSPYKTKANLLKSLRPYYKVTGMAKNPTSKVIYDTNITKKEVQKLCRKHGLSPYDTKVNLLSSLRTYFQKMNLNLFSEVESSNGCSKFLLTELLSGAQLSESTKVNKGVEDINGKFTASFVHGHRIYSHSREKHDQEIHSQTVKTNELGNLKEAGVHNKKGSGPNGSKASRISKKRLEDCASGRGHKRKRNNGLYQEGYHQHDGRILRSAYRLGQKVFPRRSIRLVSK